MQEYVAAVTSEQPEYMRFDDVWATVTVNFSMYYPIKESEVMRVYGDTL